MTQGRVSRALAGLALLGLIAACAPSRGPTPKQRAAIERVLASAPGQANPSAVVATELAFARTAREEGQWTAFRAYAAPGALIHGRGGVIEALPWLAGQKNPPAAVQWAPRELWSSCDGKTVISHGRFAEPEGQFGYFVTVWERQAEGEYRYVYDFGWPDADLTRAEQARLAREGEDDGSGILVEAYSMIKAEVADCPKAEAIPPRPLSVVAASSQEGSTTSRDGTLHWGWEQRADGTRIFRSHYLHNGTWAEALVRIIPPAAE